jgi:hypothetical protein
MAPPPDDPSSPASNRPAGPADAADAPSARASNDASDDASDDASNDASDDASNDASNDASDDASNGASSGAAPGGVPGGGSGDTPEADGDGGTFEKWMVRILLVLVFGVAFGIEGMTLLRSYLVETGGEPDAASQVEEPPALRPGSELLPGTAPRATVTEMMVYVNPDAWTFTLRVEVANDTDRPYSLSFESLETENGRTLAGAWSHDWAPGDTASATASWALAPGDRPAALTVRAQANPDSAAAVTRTLPIGDVPARRQ